jgi:hypothetical protein
VPLISYDCLQTILIALNMVPIKNIVIIFSVALDLLLRKAQKPGAWQGPSKTVEYLQRLGILILVCIL